MDVLLIATRPKRHKRKGVVFCETSRSDTTKTRQKDFQPSTRHQSHTTNRLLRKRKRPNEANIRVPGVELDSPRSSHTESPPESEDSDFPSENEEGAIPYRPSKRRRTTQGSLMAPPPTAAATPGHDVQTSRASRRTSLLPPVQPPSVFTWEMERNTRILVNFDSFEREVFSLPSAGLANKVRDISQRIAASREWMEMVDDYRFSQWPKPGIMRSGDSELLLMDLFNLVREKAAMLGLSSSFVTPIWYGRREVEDEESRPKRIPRPKYPGLRIRQKSPQPPGPNSTGQYKSC